MLDRYKYCLSDLDPKDKLKDIRGPMRSYYTFCPFCKSNSKGPSFQFDSTDEGDHWRCFNCHRSGKSDRLWARLTNWGHRTDWRKIMADVCPTTAVGAAAARIVRRLTLAISKGLFPRKVRPSLSVLGRFRCLGEGSISRDSLCNIYRPLLLLARSSNSFPSIHQMKEKPRFAVQRRSHW